MSTLHLIRHGQASFQAERYDQLSAIGQRQSAAIGACLAATGIVFDQVVIGPRLRHRQTAEITLRALADPPPMIMADGLDEFADGEQILAAAQRHFGFRLEAEPAMTQEQKLLHYAAMVKAWAEGEGIIDGRPSAADFRAAVRVWLAQHQSSTAKSQQVLAFTSAGTIALVVCEVLGLATRLLPTLAAVLNNASITEIIYTPRQIALRNFNVATHLPANLLTTI